MNALHSILMHLPTVVLSADRDRAIRAALAASSPLRAYDAPPLPDAVFRFPRLAFVALAIILTFGSVGAYAYASPAVTRGDALYGVKRAVERVQGSWQRTPIRQVAYHSNLALRRAAELETLTRGGGRAAVALVSTAYAAADEQVLGDDRIVATAAEVTMEATAAARAADAMSEPTVAARAIAVLTASHSRVRPRLLMAAANVGADGQDRAVEAIVEAVQTTDELAAATAVADAEVRSALARRASAVRMTIATSAAARAPGSDAEIRDALASARASLPELRAELAAADAPEAAVDRLLARIAAHLDSAESALARGDRGAAAGLLRAAQALRRNAAHFLRAPSRADREGRASSRIGSDDARNRPADQRGGARRERGDDRGTRASGGGKQSPAVVWDQPPRSRDLDRPSLRSNDRQTDDPDRDSTVRP